MLKINKVSKKFGEIVALEDVSFDVDEGEFVFITGPSGAGKTTLIRLILRELTPDTGEILFGDVDITTLPQKKIPKLRQNIGVVFQDFKVLPERTLKENVSVALAVSGVDPSEWDDRVDQVLKLVGLMDRKSLFPSQLSGGELQRVSLARALVVNPKIILADEPTGNLDWDTADAMMDLFKKINNQGKTIIMATHHKLIVDKLGKRVIEFKDGKVSSKDKASKNSKTDDKIKKDIKKNKVDTKIKQEKSEKEKKKKT